MAKSASGDSSATGSGGFTKSEKAAMRERARELKAEARAKKNREDGERALLEKIGEMSGSDKEIAERLHAIISDVAPELWPRTWYGMPAWARDGKVVCFFQGAEKFESRYATLGFSDAANHDHGVMWATAFALTELSDVEEARIGKLIKRAAAMPTDAG